MFFHSRQVIFDLEGKLLMNKLKLQTSILVLYPVKVTLKKIKISLYGLIAEVLRGEVVSFAGNLDCVEVFNTLLNQIFQFCQSLRM